MKVLINQGARNVGDVHRAISLGQKMVDGGVWDGHGVLIFEKTNDVHEALRETQLTGELTLPTNYTMSH